MKTIHRYGIFLLLVLVVNSCNLYLTEKPLPPSEISPQPTGVLPSPSEMSAQPSVTSAPPTKTPDPFPNPVLKITGEEDVVFDWTNDRCEKYNVADLPSRAFRGADGQVQFILSHFVSYRMVGPDLNNLEIDCNPIFSSDYDADPSLFNDSEWLAAPYTEDGQIIYALVHDEYEGHMHPGQCDKNYWYPPCWYGNLTLAVSTDGGQTYHHIAPPPANRFAGLPYRYESGAGPYGIFAPSNIIKGQDGYYYNLGQVQYYGNLDQGVCLMRTDNLSDPTAWRYWNGSAFKGRFLDPYKEDISNPKDYVCPPLEWDNIGASLVESLTYNTYLDRYVLVGISADWLDNREVWGFYYSFSNDLIHWTHRKLLLEITLPWTAKNNTDVMYLYPSLLDPQSDSRNFETTGKTAYLYYTRQNFGQGSLDRDLIRVAVEFFPSEAEVPKAIVNSSEEASGPMALNILKKDFTVSADTPVELTLNWEAKTREQVIDFLSNAQVNILLDEEPLPNTMDFWGDIKESGGRYSSQWLYPIGTLKSGMHMVEIQLSLTNPVSDGLGNEYSGEFFQNILQIYVKE